MRKEPFSVGSLVHVLKRGARGLPLTKELNDQWRFVRLLYHLNDEFKDDFWEENTLSLSMFGRHASWPARKELVRIHAWVLMSNHFHLLLEEIEEGGIAKFMKKLCGSMTMHFNKKYKEKGSLFQGAYKSRTVGRDEHLRYLMPYIMVKNVFELYPSGWVQAASNFNHAWEWATEKYSFSSLPDYMGMREFPIISPDTKKFCDPKDFYHLSEDMIKSRLERKFPASFDFE